MKPETSHLTEKELKKLIQELEHDDLTGQQEEAEWED